MKCCAKCDVQNIVGLSVCIYIYIYICMASTCDMPGYVYITRLYTYQRGYWLRCYHTQRWKVKGDTVKIVQKSGRKTHRSTDAGCHQWFWYTKPEIEHSGGLDCQHKERNIYHVSSCRILFIKIVLRTRSHMMQWKKPKEILSFVV